MPSENVATWENEDRRTRKRRARRDHLLDLADELVAQRGVEGLTMAALAEAADYATASLYTYFPSRSALLAALQRRALATLSRVAADAVEGWARQLAASTESDDERVRSLACLWAFSDLFLSAPEHHPREFRLQQELLIHPGAEDTADAAEVVPDAMAVLDVPRELLADAVRSGALRPHPRPVDPIGEPVDGDLLRTFTWIVGLNGALMVDRLTTGLPSTGTALGGELTGTLMAGWGASLDELTTAREMADGLHQPTAGGGTR